MNVLTSSSKVFEMVPGRGMWYVVSAAFQTLVSQKHLIRSF
jgi:hypothetical protein